ncbi:MAG: MMPL family transporter [Bacillota bacterium]|nr:MMPL family transporter [Bacillota bacterium]
MKAILKGKWFVLVAWIAVIAILAMSAPNMENLVREKGQIKVPDGYSSTLAQKILKDVQDKENSGKDVQTALVFHSNKKLTKNDIAEAKDAVDKLIKDQTELGITSITTHFNEPDLKKQLLSKDGKTILVSLNVASNGRDAKEISKDLYKAIDHCKLEHYYTGSWMIDEDLVTNSQQGLKKTEGITVVFILAVLILVFRSAIAPLIPLVTVGISYLTAQSIVAILVDKVNFPLSTFTQIFLVAVLFGIGTDYCILLLSRFKEELAKGITVTAAILETYRTAGKTVFFSGIAVMFGFATIGLSTFKLYQSASAVAIGVAILLLALVTVVPFFMAVLGKKLFWPSKGKLEHSESKIWGFAGTFSLSRPFTAFLLVAIISVPFLFIYKGHLSYNSLEEIGNGFNSIKGFTIISDAFGPGESMPTQIVIKNDVEMDSSDYVAITEKMSQELKKVENVKTVRSITRPTGQVIDDLYLSSQVKSLNDGIGKGNDGILKISNGLQTAGDQLAANKPKMKQATDGISSLISGTEQLENGMTPLKEGLLKIEDGMKKGSAGSEQIQIGMNQIKNNSQKLVEGYKQLLAGYKQAEDGLATLSSNYQSIAGGINSLHNSLMNTNQYFSNLEKDYTDIQQNQNYQAIKMTVKGAESGAETLYTNVNQLNTALSGAQNGIAVANANFEKAIAGKEALVQGMEGLAQGIKQQQMGLNALANGQGQIVSNLLKFSGGLSSINSGQQQLYNGFKDLGSQIDQLTSGLSQSANGLHQVSKGLDTASNYLSKVSNEKQNGFYIPDEILKGNDFAKVLDTYMSKDRKVMTIDVVFNKNPYSNTAIHRVPELKQAIQRAVKGTKLEDAKVAIGGVSSIYNDLNTISGHDYSRTVILMLSGIALILMILLRSIIMPLYLIGSLVLTYYTSMAISETIFVDWLGYTGISWAVPFFAFVILIALGIDYSIFLMDRFNEYKHMPVEKAILSSMKKMGTVIISAAIILAGTFAAMIPAGVLSLLEIATILLIGLFLYAFIILPLFVPVMVKTFGEANWWPFMNRKSHTNETDITM